MTCDIFIAFEILLHFLFFWDSDGLIVVASALGVTVTRVAIRFAANTLTRKNIPCQTGMLIHPVRG